MAEDQWTDNEWMGNLRMSKVTFQKLCEELAPFIERRDMNYHKAISLRERVAITLYRLADTGPVIAQCQISLAWENEQFAKSCSRISYITANKEFLMVCLNQVVLGTATVGFFYCNRLPLPSPMQNRFLLGIL
ncbi:PREDICTED: uncharacterized protein LOC107343003 [Acropora digitifera]|uniref:uncharacterized protein LOC107343003 n=1 Tax=Acropora digitifera TaxID=70779 RepID=UPI00077B035C|nr:PREDICTED: uncharacterized protein LOC107343003 [Acropora digitifera]